MSQPETAPEPASADDFFADVQSTANGFPPIEVPGLTVNGKPVLVRKISAAEIAEFWKETKSQGDELQRAAVVCFGVCDAAGNRLLKKEQAISINGLLAAQIVPIAQFFLESNGLSGPKS